jgi:PhnB protein
MSIKTLNPYLTLDGTADKAIKHYERTLGARTEAVMRFGDVKEMKTAPEHEDRVMHAMLHVGGGVLMLSDTMPGQPAAIGTNVQVALHFDQPADMAAKFDALAAGGKVTFPIHDAFWGAKFGMLVDAFGVSWIFNCELKQG